MNKDLYRTLGVSPDATGEEVKRAYRRIALLYHPDRNRTGMEAEDHFKEANYAYSILGNREKRRRYDLYREFVKLSDRWGISPSPYPDRILTDLFLDPKLPGMGRWFDEILKALDPSGDGGTFWSLSRATLQLLRRLIQEETRKRGVPVKKERFRAVHYPRTVLKKVGSVLIPPGVAPGRRSRSEERPPSGRESPARPGSLGKRRGADIEWTLPLTQEEAARGARLTVSFFRDSQWDRLSLRVPPGTREGVRLRVRNKGNRIDPSGEAGDVYFRVLIR
jgi:curved DNA-binding protein CbpA